MPGARRAVPPRVRESWLLWLVTCGLIVLAAVVGLATTGLGDLAPDVLDELRRTRDTAAASGEQTPGLDALWASVRVVLGFASVLVAGALVGAAFALRSGQRWARVVLDVVAVLLVVMAVDRFTGVLFGALLETGSAGGAAATAARFVPVAGVVLAGLCAGVAQWQLRTPEVDEFLGGKGGRGAGPGGAAPRGDARRPDDARRPGGGEGAGGGDRPGEAPRPDGVPGPDDAFRR